MRRQKMLHRQHPLGTTPFEAFYNGSWHGVDLLSIKYGHISIQLNYHGSVIEERISGDHLRVRSRKANAFDCIHLLRSGIDVCVLSAQPISEDSDQEQLTPLTFWHDAKIISIKRAHHEGRCACLFSVILYRNKAPTSMIRNPTDRMVQMVTIDNISILQKLHCDPCEEGFHHWMSSEDCISYGKSKLLSGTISSEVSWLVVLSILKGINFNMKLMQNRIIYHILNSNQWPSKLDDVQSHDDKITTVHFQRCNDGLQPKIETLAAVVLAENTVSVTTMEADTTSCAEESESDVEILYDHMNLRRSKRQRMLPDRFVSYSLPNFNHHLTKKMDHDKNRVEQSKTTESITPMEEKICKEKSKQCINSSSKHKESSRTASVLEGNNLSDGKAREPLHKTPFVIDIEEMDSFVVGEEYRKRYSLSGSEVKLSSKEFQKGRILQSSHKIHHFSSGSYQKSYSKRKKLLSPTECNKLIEKLVGTIKAKIEGQFQPDVDQEINQHAKFPEELELLDFNWSPSSESDTLIAEEEHEDLWKEMEHSLTTLALFEQKQKLDSEFFSGKTNIPGRDEEKQCQHNCKLNEQIGITCQLCNFVLTEIRYVSQPFLKNDGCVASKFGREEHQWRGSIDLEPDPFSTGTSSSETPLSGGSDNKWTSLADLKLKLHLHQKKAFEFIWRNIAGCLKTEEKNNPAENTGGCVISHSPGSGKTLLVITFLFSYLGKYPKSRPLILAPKAAVYVWYKEFEKWGISIPVYLIHPLESYKKEMWNTEIKFYSPDHRRPSRRMMHVMDCLQKLRQWLENPSILLMSYPSFFSLTHKGKNIEYRRFMEDLLRKSPGILILDEGHNPRSTKSKLRKFLMKVNTEYRILLSGTLFQNNFEEYFNTLCLARPRFINDVLKELDPKMVYILNSRKLKKSVKMDRKERLARRLFVEEIGEKIESSVEDERKQGFDLLSRITSGFIDMYDGEKSDMLPGLQIYTLLLASTDIQREVLTRLQYSITQKRCPLELELLITVGSIHPWLIKTITHVSDFFNADELNKIDKHNFRSGSKVKFVIDLVHKSIIRGERVLIFCHNISPINFFVELFEIIFGWFRGEQLLVLQGDQELFVRAKIMGKFNGDTENKCKVLLASTGACAEGISLTGASRVVLLDSEWNHSKTRQAIARAFRPGQEKMVYVYRLLSSRTWEEDKYRSNEWKAWLSKMIFIGKYIRFSSSKVVDDIDDEMLREMAEEDQTRTYEMIMKQD